MRQNKTMTLMNRETGEILENVKSVTTENQENYLKKSREIQRERQEFVDNYGNFYFLKYKKNKTYEEDILDSDSARIIFLASYMDYDGKLKFDDGLLIRKQDLPQLLKISTNKFYELYKRLTTINLLVMNEDKSLSLNSNKFIKGKIKTKDEYTRLFIHAVRTLYENCSTREYESLGLIYRLIPYINYKHNILCTNPHEKDVDKIEALTFADISTIFGYVKTRAEDVVKMLSKFNIIHEYYGKLYIFGYVGIDINILNSKIKINPLLMYSGLNVDMDDVVLNFTQNTRAIEQRKNSKNVKALNGISFEQNKLNNKNKKNKQNLLHSNLYLLRFIGNDEIFYKIGITSNINHRISQLESQTGYTITLLKTITVEKSQSLSIEQSIINDNLEYKYIPIQNFKGMYECFNKEIDINI